VLVPVNWTSQTLEENKALTFNDIDKLSISNVGKGSERYNNFTHSSLYIHSMLHDYLDFAESFSVFLIHCGLYLNNILPVSSACRLWAHLTMTYVFTFWTFYILYKEYKVVATMRLNFLASEERRPDQFTVRSPLVSCIYFILIKISNTNSLINYSVFDDMYIIILTCRFWCEMCPQIQMNQSVSMFNIFFL
jgi:Late exocytosis, associated with Golgi transport